MIRRARGFTLVEVLVSLAVFAVMSGLAYGGLRAVMDARTRVSGHSDTLAALQATFRLLDADLAAARARPVRDAQGDTEPAFRGGVVTGELAQLTIAGGAPGPAGGCTPLCRVEWRLDDGRLVRREWPMLDRVPGAVPGDAVVLEEVAAATMRYHDSQWQVRWPLDGADASAIMLPRAVELRLTLRDGVSVRRLFLLGSRT